MSLVFFLKITLLSLNSIKGTSNFSCSPIFLTTRCLFIFSIIFLQFNTVFSTSLKVALLSVLKLTFSVNLP